jgi:hypothetical protein
MFKSEGIKQDNTGRLYMILTDVETGESFDKYIEARAFPEFDLRPVGGHLWLQNPEKQYIAQQCKFGCPLCGGRKYEESEELETEQ